jgi:hypothetical protein
VLFVRLTKIFDALRVDKWSIVDSKIHKCDDPVLARAELSVSISLLTDFDVTCRVNLFRIIWQIKNVSLCADHRQYKTEVVEQMLRRLRACT